jgi:hypothetical protein
MSTLFVIPWCGLTLSSFKLNIINFVNLDIEHPMRKKNTFHYDIIDVNGLIFQEIEYNVFCTR